MNINIMATTIARNPKNLITPGYFDSAAALKNKMPKTILNTIANI